MQFEQIHQAIHERRSIRKFTDAPVSNEAIGHIIDCARYAPSDTNSQTWEFLVIKKREMIQEIEQMTLAAIATIAEEAATRGLEREGRLLMRSFAPYATAFRDAPVLIVCLATPYESKFREKIFDPLAIVPDHVWAEEGIKSSCLASQNLMLAAHALGLGTCPMTGPVLLANEALRTYLEIPAEKEINMVISLGVPAETPRKLPRKSVAEIMTIIE
ncbi:MAG: nitroreductase family protein [Bacilli bacterium]